MKNISQPSKISLTECDTTKKILNLSANSPEIKWLDNNQIECNKIHEFLNLWKYSNDSVEFIKEFLKLKLSNEEYKLERFIELYCLLQQNPNALIDGTLPLEK